MLNVKDDYTNNNEGPESPLNILKVLAVCAHRVIQNFSPVYQPSIHFTNPSLLSSMV